MSGQQSREPVFGESFPHGASAASWMDAKIGKSVLVDEKGDLQLGDLPPEMKQVALDIRRELRKEIVERVPENIDSLEGFFDRIHQTVGIAWEARAKGALEVIRKTVKTKLDTLEEGSDDKNELTKLNAVLLDDKDLELQLSIRQMGRLEALKTKVPEAWRMLVMASSERQLAEITLARRWLAEAPEEFFAKLGISQQELTLFVSIAADLGKYIDHAYLKQIHLTEMPGGMTKSITSIADKPGAKYVYDISNQSGESKVLSYAEVFSYEWKGLEHRFDRIIERVKRLLKLQDEKKRLPAVYGQFIDYLEAMKACYASRETDPDKIFEQWQDLKKMADKLVSAGCPMVLIQQATPGATGDSNKVDTEVRLGIVTAGISKMKAYLNELQKEAQALLTENKNALREDYDIAKVILTLQPYAFGPNLHWMCRGEEDRNTILTHTNAVRDVAEQREMPYLKKMFGPNVVRDKTVYVTSAIAETAFHEMAHTVLSRDDEKVAKRVGTDNHILEELKAEVVSFGILNRASKKGVKLEGLELRDQFLAKLGTNLDYLMNKSSEPGSSSERYYFSAVALIDLLLEKGIIIENEAGSPPYRIENPEEGIRVIARFGDEVLKLYKDDVSTPEKAKEFVELQKAKADKPDVKKFIETLKAG